MSVVREIKKQIDRQTREKVGNVKVQAQSSIFSEETGSTWNIGRTGEPPVVIWLKTSYSMDRGSTFELTPEAFNAPFSQYSTQMVPTITGNFRETNTIPYYNCRYSGWAGIIGGGTASLSIRTGNSNVSVYVDNIQVFNAELETFTPIDIEFAISDNSYIEIFWYSYLENNSIAVIGDLSYQLSSWNTADSTPFFKTIEWYDDGNPATNNPPISTNASWNYGLDNYITLRWWLNLAEDLENNPDITIQSITQDIGGFGIWSIDFLEVGELDVIDGDTIVVPGYQPSIAYIRIPSLGGVSYIDANGDTITPDDEGRVIPIEYIQNYNRDDDLSTLISTSHMLTDADDGRIVEIGIMRNVADMVFSSLSSLITDVFSTAEHNLIRGQRYYYLIDTFDSSPSKNRGGMTEEYQTIVAGDYTAPESVSGLIGTRNSATSVTVTWDDMDQFEVERYYIYTDAYSKDYAVSYLEQDFGVVDDYADLQAIWLEASGYPNDNVANALTISIEAGSVKYIRKVSTMEGGVVSFNESIPSTATTGTIRVVTQVGSYNNSPVNTPPTPRPPREITAE